MNQLTLANIRLDMPGRCPATLHTDKVPCLALVHWVRVSSVALQGTSLFCIKSRTGHSTVDRSLYGWTRVV